MNRKVLILLIFSCLVCGSVLKAQDELMSMLSQAYVRIGVDYGITSWLGVALGLNTGL